MVLAQKRIRNRFVGAVAVVLRRHIHACITRQTIPAFRAWVGAIPAWNGASSPAAAYLARSQGV
jgi:hypothetical protein